jgi:SPASM domain peptide maturase of grasp-with-spasm system
LNELDSLGCSSIQFRAFSKFDKSRVLHILDLVAESRIQDLKFLIPDKIFNYDELRNVLQGNARVSEVVIFGAFENREESIYNASVFYTSKKEISAKSCGVICSSNFSVSISHYTEARSHNSCLNKKISVDKIGNIKSCPSSSLVFGNVFENTLGEILKKGEVKKMWDITKDQIEVCKDCEFRYMCTDCRVFTEDSSSLSSKPEKCNYDPYNAIWLDSENSSPLQYEPAE